MPNSLKPELPIFYIYVLLDIRHLGKFIYEKENQKIEFDFEPYYIGKGGATGDKRPLDHLDEAIKTDKSNHKLNLIRKLIKENLEFKYIFLKENLTEDETFEWEKYYIKLIGREDLKLGPLTNLTDGGDGRSNFFTSKETKIKISIAVSSSKNGMYNHIYTEETLQKMRKPKTEEHIKNFIEARTGVIPEKIECKYCHKKLDPGNHNQWHGDKCNKKPGNENIKKDAKIVEKFKNTMKNKKDNGYISPNRGKKMKKIICSKCQKEIGVNNFSRHICNRK